MKIALSADHAGFELKEKIYKYLESKGHSVTDFGTYSKESIDYPEFAYVASKSIVEHNNELGILICGSGVGVSITANKVKGIRAANCFNEEMATLARQHNNANVLCLGARFINADLALTMVERFISTDFEGGRHKVRVDKIHDLTGC